MALTIISALSIGLPRAFSYLEKNLNSKDCLLIYTILGLVLGVVGCCVVESKKQNSEETRRVDREAAGDDVDPSTLINSSAVSAREQSISTLLCDARYVVIAACNSCSYSLLIYQIGLINEIASLYKNSFSPQTLFMIVQCCSYLPITLLGNKPSNDDSDSNFIKYLFQKFMKYPRKNLYILFCVVNSVNIFIFNANDGEGQILILIYTIIFSMSSAAIIALTNLVYIDCYPQNFNNAVIVSNSFRVIFSLLLLSFNVDMLAPKLYLISSLMLFSSVVWKFVDLIPSKSS